MGIEQATAATETATVDIVIPAYRETPEAIRATVSACLKQTYPVRNIYLVDDGSPEPISLPDELAALDNVRMVRLTENRGISAGRNVGIKLSDAPFVACVNIEVLLDYDWVATCIGYLLDHSYVGLATARTVPQNPNTSLAKWRMRFQEPPYPQESGPMRWAAGHALMFRSEALRGVQGFNEQLRLAGEDSDICFRLQKNGWETHYLNKSGCTSIQIDSAQVLGKAEYNRNCCVGAGSSFMGSVMILTGRAFQRLLRHVVFGRLSLIYPEFTVLGSGIKVAWGRRRKTRC